MSLVLLLQVTGAKLDAPNTTKTFFLSSGAFSDGSTRYLPLINTSPTQTAELFAPRTQGQDTAGAPGQAPLEIELARYKGGDVDRLAEPDLFSFDDQDGVATIVGEGNQYHMPGAVTVAAGGTVVTGGDTSALNTASLVEISGERHKVDSITDGLTFTLATPNAAGATGKTAVVHPIYTVAEPRPVAAGKLVQTARNEVKTTFSIQPELKELDQLITSRYAGHGEATYFKGTGHARSPVGMIFGPAGDWTIGCRPYLMLEEIASADRVLMDNADISLLLDSGKPKIVVKTSTGTHTLTADDSITIEDFSDVGARFDESADRLDLLVDGIEVKSILTVDGSPDQTGNRWVVGANITFGQKFTGVVGKFSWFSAYLSDDDAAEILTKPLFGSEDDLDFLLPGDIEIGASTLLETADANLDPQDFEIFTTEGTDWARASFLEGLAETFKPFALGPVRHALATNVDLEHTIMRFDGGPIQDVDVLYESGESTSADQLPAIPGAYARGATRNTLKQVLDNTPGLATFDEGPGKRVTFTNGSDSVTGVQTLFLTSVAVGDRVKLDADDLFVPVHFVTSNTALILSAKYTGTGGTGAGSRSRNLYDVWPQKGAVRLARFDAGDVTVDYQGRGVGVRGFGFDGVDDEFNFGTSDNGMFTTDFEVEFFATWANTDLPYDLLSNFASGPDRGILFESNAFVGGYELDFSLFLSSGKVSVVSDPIHPGVTSHFVFQINISGGVTSATLFHNLVEVGTSSLGSLPSVSPGDLILGDFGKNNPFFGAVFDLRFLSGNRTLAEIRREALIDLPTGRTGLRHYYPANLQSFPTATLVDEADIGGLPGTISGSPDYVGGPTPSWALAQVDVLSRTLSGLGDSGVDLTDEAYAADTAAVGFYTANDASAREALSAVRQSVNLWDLVTPAGVYQVGRIADPASVTPVASFVFPRATDLHIGTPKPLPTEIHAAHSWIYHRDEFIGVDVAPKLRRLWAKDFQIVEGILHRNVRLGLTEKIIEIDSRFHTLKTTRPELERQKDLHGVRRPPVSAKLFDPGWLATPGSVIEVTHADLAGGAPTNLIVMAPRREILQDWVNVGLWGWEDEA